MLHHLNNKLNNLEKLWIVVIGIALLLIIGMIDYVTGFEISMSFFYIAPVGLVTWYAGKRLGLALSIIARAILFLIAIVTNQKYSHPAILYWNIFLEFAYYFLIVLLITKVKTNIDFEKQLARTDTLTKIANRLMFMEQLNSCYLFSERSKEPFSLAYIDVDNFKNINDKYGHEKGDDVLQAIATLLISQLRRIDTVARLGGDEFVILLPNTNTIGAQNLVDKIQLSIQDNFNITNLKVTTSIGVVTFKNLLASSTEAIKIADSLMYTVKQSGRNAIKFSVF
jgi:diguanylate cyclase (GGDEF)-like protein